MSDAHSPTNRDRGQTTVLMAGVMVVVFGLVIGLALFGRAAVDRARARTAADAIALATVDEPGAVSDLEIWYSGAQGAMSTASSGHALSGVGASQAGAWAEAVADEVSAAPAVRAVIERASQVLGIPLGALRIDGTEFWLPPSAAAAFERVAAEFGACRVGESAAAVQFVLC